MSEMILIFKSSLDHAAPIECCDSPVSVKEDVFRWDTLVLTTRPRWNYISCRNLLVICAHIMLANYVVQF